MTFTVQQQDDNGVELDPKDFNNFRIEIKLSEFDLKNLADGRFLFEVFNNFESAIKISKEEG